MAVSDILAETTSEAEANLTTTAEWADPAPDAAAEDVGNVVALEHVNVCMPDQRLATLFYLMGLGLTRDPYTNVGVDNMWVNVGAQQFHLPTRDPQVISGHVGLVVPDLHALEAQLRAVAPRLAGTAFSWAVEADHIAATSPWGNRVRCFAPDPAFGRMVLGIPYVEFLVPGGSAEPIAHFYREALHAPAFVLDLAGSIVGQVNVGRHQWLRFRETGESLPPYDGHHVAIYIANFSGPYRYLRERGLISEDIRNHQFRFQSIVDPTTGEPVLTLEHEVRSMLHPQYARPLVNRDT